VEHDGVCALVGIGNVRHEIGVNGIAPMTTPWVVEVDDVELRLDLVAVGMLQQVVEGNGGEVWVFVIVAIERIALLNLLLDEVVHHGIRLAATRRTEYDGGTEGIDHVNPTLVPFLLVVETGGQVDGILVFHQPCLLLKTLVLIVENIVHQVVLQQSAHPQTSHHQADIANGYGEDVECRHHIRVDGQEQHPPVDDEVEHKASADYSPYPRPSNLLALYAFRAETRKCKQKQCKEFGVEDRAKQTCLTVEIQQDAIHYTDIDAVPLYGGIA
ncbi:MAG: Uncharacterized protein F083_3260, partial [bacterium F083]